MKSVGAAAGKQFGYSVADKVVNEAGDYVAELVNTRRDIWLLEGLTRDQLSPTDLAEGKRIYKQLSDLDLQVKELIDPPINWMKVAIVVSLVALAVFAVVSGYATIASMPALLATIASTSFQDNSENRKNELENKKHSLQKQLDSLIIKAQQKYIQSAAAVSQPKEGKTWAKQFAASQGDPSFPLTPETESFVQKKEGNAPQAKPTAVRAPTSNTGKTWADEFKQFVLAQDPSKAQTSMTEEELHTWMKEFTEFKKERTRAAQRRPNAVVEQLTSTPGVQFGPQKSSARL